MPRCDVVHECLYTIEYDHPEKHLHGRHPIGKQSFQRGRSAASACRRSHGCFESGTWYYPHYMQELTELSERVKPIFKKYGIKKAGVFGSFARGDARPESDIDFLFDAGDDTRISLLDLVEMKEELSALLGRAVDLVPDGRVVARMRPSIKRDLRIIYERR